MTDEDAVDKVQKRAKEKVELPRAELWMLRVAAATGVVSMLAHGVDLIHEIGLF